MFQVGLIEIHQSVGKKLLPSQVQRRVAEEQHDASQLGPQLQHPDTRSVRDGETRNNSISNF